MGKQQGVTASCQPSTSPRQESLCPGGRNFQQPRGLNRGRAASTPAHSIQATDVMTASKPTGWHCGLWFYNPHTREFIKGAEAEAGGGQGAWCGLGRPWASPRSGLLPVVHVQVIRVRGTSHCDSCRGRPRQEKGICHAGLQSRGSPWWQGRARLAAGGGLCPRVPQSARVGVS